MAEYDTVCDLRADTEIPGQLAEDEFYRALADQKRRRVLAYLFENDRCSEEELADVICGRKSKGSGIGPADRHGEVLLSLCHVHLPLLDDADLVSYDRSGGVVTAISLPPMIERLVRFSVAADSR